MFDVESIFETDAWTEAAGMTHLAARWPTDEEWAARARGRKFILRRLGRGVTETLAEQTDAELKLYEKICQNGSGPLTREEASKFIDTIGSCEPLDVTMDGDRATVLMQTPAGKVSHSLKIPSVAQITRYRRAGFRSLDLPYSKSEIRVFLEPAAALWDECGGTSADYKSGIPNIHKDVALQAVISHIERETGPKLDENF